MNTLPALSRLLLALLVTVAGLSGAGSVRATGPSTLEAPDPPEKRFERQAGSVAHPDRIIVQFKPSTSHSSRASVRRAERLEKLQDLGLVRAEVVRVQGRSAREAVRDLSRHPRVERATLDYIRHPSGYADEPRFPEQWGHHNTGQVVKGLSGTPDVDVNAPEGAAETQGDPNLVVAVIDDGVDFSHPDLAGRQWVNPGESGQDPNGQDKATNNQDDDGNGYTDDVHGWDFCHNDNTVHDPIEADAHGTHVAGIIAAGINGQGIAGVAPGVKIMALKFLGPGCGYDSQAIRAISYAKSQGARIVNASWGGPYHNSVLRDAIAASGSLFVAAAGNSNSSTPSYPAGFDSRNILSVASLMNRGYLSTFSNYGPGWVHVAAPGEQILSTLPSVPQRPGMTLSSPATGRAVVTGFGLEEVYGAAPRADLVSRAFQALGRGSEPVLLVDDDSSYMNVARYPDVAPTIASAIQTATGSPPDEVVAIGGGSLPSEVQLDGKVVVWATGRAWSSGDGYDTALTSTDQYRLRTFLEGGGKLLLTGMDALLFIERYSFVRDVLGLHVLSDVGLDERGREHLSGLTGTTFEGGTYDVTKLASSRPLFHDVLLPAAGGTTAVLGNYDSTPATYASWDGTSMAAPYATGVAALVGSVRANLLDDPHALRTLVTYGGKPVSLTSEKTLTGKMVDARAAIAATRETTPPAGTVQHRDGARQYTNTPTIPLALSAQDPAPGSGVAYMRFSNDGTNWSGWEPFATTRAWTLTAGDGMKTVRVQYRDGAGNQSLASSFSLLLDTRAPSVTPRLAVLPVPSGLGTSTVPVRSSWSGSDGTGAGINSYWVERSVNGGVWQRVLPATELSTTATQLLVPGSATYQYRVRAADKANNWSGWFYGKSFSVVAAQETSPAISYSGTWTRSALSGSYGGYVRHSSVKGASARYSFTGRSIGLVTTKGPDRGKAAVYVDGAYVRTVDLYRSSGLVRQVVFTRANLDPKVPHTIEVRLPGSKHTASKGYRVDVDAFVNLDNGSPLIKLAGPGFVTNSPVTQSAIRVSQAWSGRDDSCGARTLLYEVQRRAKSGSTWGAWTWVARDITATSVTRSLAPGMHQYRVRGLDCAGRYREWGVGREFTLSWEPESTAAATYDGPWTSEALVGAGGGSVLYGTSHYSDVQFRIPGSAVAFVSVKGPDRGVASARVAGGEVSSLDLYSPSVQTGRVVYARSGLNPTYDNPLYVGATGAKNQASSGFRVDVDGFLVIR
ncbi:MAG: S8 family serine peptidase [Chloroflexota bacterium]|nr:S8 family serine peptidase [Chloroflexota bacterium]